MCHAGTKSARPSIAPSSELRCGLTLIERLRPFYTGLGRKSRSGGRKLSIPSNFSHSSRMAWRTVNKHSGRSGSSFHQCPVSANSIATQLVKNGTHRTGDRVSSRLVNKDLTDLRKIRTSEGHCISEPFRPEEISSAIRRLKPGKSPELHSIFPEIALRSWFCDFSVPACAFSNVQRSGEEH